MKINLTILFSIISFGIFAQDSVTVTFNINTAGVAEPITDKSIIKVVSERFYQVYAKNIGGDYWKAVVRVPKNISLTYQFYVNSREIDIWGDYGLEEEVNTPSGKRELIVGTNNINVPLQWVNGWSSSKPTSNARPYTPTDSIDVWFRVNVTNVLSGVGFDPMAQVIGVRGDDLGISNPPISWGTTLPLNPEKDMELECARTFENGNKFWSGVIKFPVDKVGQTLNYKFVISNKGELGKVVTWEDGQNRMFQIPQNDTSLHWDYFNRQKGFYDAFPEEVLLKFTVDLARAIEKNSFDPNKDSLFVSLGLNNSVSDPAMFKMKRDTNNIYSKTVYAAIYKNSPLHYAYIKKTINQFKQTQILKEIFTNYQSDVKCKYLDNRLINYAEIDTIIIDDIEFNNVTMRRSPIFSNTTPLAQNTTLVLEVDYRPVITEVKKYDAAFTDFSGQGFILDKSNIDNSVIYVNGPVTKITDNKDWAEWNTNSLSPARKMYDDGTHGDLIAGDSIHTSQFNWLTTAPGAFVTQSFQFGINGYQMEAPNSYLHFYNFLSGQPIQKIRVAFGENYPLRYPHWNYKDYFVLDVSDNQSKPNQMVLSQNYPNPFNPSTVISYQLSAVSHVKLIVFDVLGREVALLVNSTQSPGSYSIPFSGSNLTSGIYFYKLTAGNTSVVKKMILVR